MTTELITEDVNTTAMIATAEIDQAIATAKRYPRDIKEVLAEAEAMAMVDEDTAASMFYVLPRRNPEGELIEGPSTRLAEVFASCYGNLRFGSRIIQAGATHLTAQGICYDVQKNVSSSVEIERRITYKDGTRYNDDAITNAANAAASIAMRNAIFKVIPRTYVNAIMKKAKLAAKGNVKSIVESRDKCLAYFRKLGVNDEVVLRFAGVAEVVELTEDHLVALRSVVAVIKSGERTLEEALGMETSDEADVDNQSPPEDTPPDIDWAWLEKQLEGIMTEKPLDDLRNELIELHSHQRQEIWDRCEEHRELIRKHANTK